MVAEECKWDEMVALLCAPGERVLLLGADPSGTVKQSFAVPVETHSIPLSSLQSHHLDALPTGQVFDAAFFCGVIEHLDHRHSLTLLCRVRDLHARRVYVVAPAGRGGVDSKDSWHPDDFLALGMERIAHHQGPGHPAVLYGYDIRTYKRTPDWFNARYWAHPELWDKQRW